MVKKYVSNSKFVDLVCGTFILTFCFILVSDLSNPLLRSFDSFWLSYADKGTTRTYNFVSLIVKLKLLELASTFSVPSTDKTQCFVHLRFNFTFQLINDISSDYLDILMAQQLLHFLEFHLLDLDSIE